jgi:hypothetical protein
MNGKSHKDGHTLPTLDVKVQSARQVGRQRARLQYSMAQKSSCM